MKRFLIAAGVLAAVCAAGFAATASAESTDGYLNSIAVPPQCPFAWEQPDPSFSACWMPSYAANPRIALTSQVVILNATDFEGSLADCQSWFVEPQVLTIDGSTVPITTQRCRAVAQSIDNLLTLPFFGANMVWATSTRYLIAAGSLPPGVHTITWTVTFTSDYTYHLGCGDPSGTCTVPAGTVRSNTQTLTIVQ